MTREYELAYALGIGNVFIEESLQRAEELGYNTEKDR
jgi:hypothetical protein